MQVERLALEGCVESSSGYSQGCEDVRADVGTQRDVVAHLWKFSSDDFSFVGEEGNKVISREGEGYGGRW